MWGVTLAADSVVINRRLGALERRYALAHELAHALRLQAGHRQSAQAWREERFADAFARELLLPRVVVRDAARPIDAEMLAQEYAVDNGTVLLQAAAVGIAPRLQLSANGGAVLCADCGHRPHIPGCPCRAARAAAKTQASDPAADATLGTTPGWGTTCW
jgi:hypothetical protein